MRKKVSRLEFSLVPAAVLASVGLIEAPARAADFTLKLGTTQAVGAPINVRANQCSTRIGKETNGRVELQIFPNNVLGGMSSMIGQVRSGALEFLTADVTTLSSVVPAAALPNVGWAFKTSAQGSEACDGELGSYARNAIRSKGMYCHDKMLLIGMKYVTASPRPIVKPDDFHGFKIRVPPGAISLDLFRTLGASVTTMDVNEVYTALETHVIDGEENPLVNIEFQRFFEVQRYLSMTGHQWSGYYLIGNQGAWDALPPDVRAIVSRNFGILATAQNRDVELVNDTLVDKLSRQGMTVNRPDPQPFQAELGSYYQKWKGEFGPAAWALLEKYSGKLGAA